MYSPAVITVKFAAADNWFRQRYGTGLVRHSVEQTQYAIEQIDKLLIDGQLPPRLPTEIARHIANERAICRIDFEYWSSRYAYIKTYDNRVIRFVPNNAQRIFLSRIGSMEAERKELMFQFLKARRLGVSTISQLVVQHRLQFHNNVQAIIGSDNPVDSDRLSRMMMLSFGKQPKWLRPQSGYFGDPVTPPKGRYKTGLFYEFDNDSRVDLEHGSQESDIGRGDSPSVGHLSELAKMQNAESLVDAGLLVAVLPSPSVFWVFEGTADGDDNWWAKKYRHNKANYGRVGGSARMCPTFLPWYVGEVWPTPTWLVTNEWERVKGSWCPSGNTIKHANKAREFVASNPFIKLHLGDNWEMPLHQQYFYECSIKEYKQNGILHKWAQEMASDDEECFQSTAFSIYDAELRMDIRNSLVNPTATYMLRGKDIPAKFHPSNRDASGKPPLPVRASFAHSLPPFDFELVPVKFTGYSETDPHNKLFIWEEPKDGETYYIAIDTADGLGADRSDNTVIQVLRKGDRYRNDAQVAEWASPDVSGTDIWPQMLAISTFYSVRNRGRVCQPQIVVETNREGGRELIKHLQSRGWSSFYYHLRGKTPQLGIHVTRMNRQGDDSIIQNFNQAVNNGYLKVNSYWLAGELDSFVKHTNGKIAAADGRHDDRLFAMAESYYAAYSLELRSSQPTPFIDRTREIPAAEKYPLYVNAATSSDVPYSKVAAIPEDWY